MNEQDKYDYAKWLLEECDSPFDEIEFLIDNLTEGARGDMWHPNKKEEDE